MCKNWNCAQAAGTVPEEGRYRLARELPRLAQVLFLVDVVKESF